MAEPYREPPPERPRWVYTCWPRASLWPFVVALAASLPCVVLGWQGAHDAHVVTCDPSVPVARRCTAWDTAPLPVAPTPIGTTPVERCDQLLPKDAEDWRYELAVRRRPAPFAANTLNVMIASTPVVITRSAPAATDRPVTEPRALLAACAAGQTEDAIDLEIRRRNPWLLAAPLGFFVLALRWMLSRRVRIVLDPGARTARATRLGSFGGSSSVVLDDSTRPGWITLGDTEHEGELVRAATRWRLARWLAARLG